MGWTSSGRRASGMRHRPVVSNCQKPVVAANLTPPGHLILSSLKQPATHLEK